MGSGIGPIGQALENVVVRIDALNSKSYSGTGNTINLFLVAQVL
jgi:hypothetical protein